MRPEARSGGGATGFREAAIRSLAALAIALICGALVILVTGGDPLRSFQAMAYGAFGQPNSVLRSLARATPLIFSGLGVAVALRAGLFNIGAEGQLMVGGLFAGWAGYALKGLPVVVHLPLCLVVGAAAGAVWGLVPGLLKAWRGAHEVIVTIMMNYIAIQFTHYMATNILRDQASQASATPPIQPSAELWAMAPGTNFSAGIFIAVACACIIAFVLRRTAFGFELRAVGLGAEAARAAGINVSRITVLVMAISGSLAGLAGAVEVLGVHHRFFDAFSPGYGFDSIAVAMLGNLNPFGIVASAALFGGLGSGARTMESFTTTPAQVTGIIQAVVILMVSISRFRRRK